MRREAEIFEDGQKSVFYYDSNDVLCRIETLDANDNLKVAIDYTYDAEGNNVERVVRDPLGNVLRRIMLDETGQETGQETGPPDSGPARWKLMDGSDEGIDVKGKENIGK
jgi:hypothetical protein